MCEAVTPAAAKILAAILWLAPHVGLLRATTYAHSIDDSSRMARVDPLLIAAIIQVESGWNPDKRSDTNDIGLMQVHMSARPNEPFAGGEIALRDPATNINVGTFLLRMWRTYHLKRCIWVSRHPHPFWAHFKWGYRVKQLDHATKVERLYHSLRDRFATYPWPET